MARPKKYADWQTEILYKCKRKIVYNFTKHYLRYTKSEIEAEIKKWDKAIRSYMRDHDEDDITLREARAVIKNLRRILEYKQSNNNFSMKDMDSHTANPVRGKYLLVDKTGHYPKYRYCNVCYDEFYTKIIIYDDEGNIIYEYNLLEGS